MQAELAAEAEAAAAAAAVAEEEAVRTKQTLFRLAHLHMYTKLRPHVHQFLASMQVR
jgi:ribulose 1,5-bisphosphate carboxylase large subunit-like protein